MEEHIILHASFRTLMLRFHIFSEKKQTDFKIVKRADFKHCPRHFLVSMLAYELERYMYAIFSNRLIGSILPPYPLSE